MSVATLHEKPKRRQTACPKEKRREQEKFARLTAEEIDRLTEPGHRKRVSELGRELVLKILSAK